MKYKGYILIESNGAWYLFKVKLYDNIDYYYASSVDGKRWTIGHKGKYHMSIDGYFEDIVVLLERLNRT